MIFRQLFDSVSGTYSYLLASRHGGEALIIDPVLEKVDRYIQLLNELDLRLVKAVDTHLHADHITGLGALRDRTLCITVMGEQTKADLVSMRVADGERIDIEGLSLGVLYTPGHTDDSYSFTMADRVFTGDTLLIRGTGRTDFQHGDARAQYKSIFNRLLKLPEETLVYPAHDYKGETVSTIGEEKAFNPRLKVKSVEEYVELMGNLHLPNPKMMDVAVPANMRVGLAQDEVARRGWAVRAEDLPELLQRPDVAIIDLREQRERDKHGEISGSLRVPYGEPGRCAQARGHPARARRDQDARVLLRFRRALSHGGAIGARGRAHRRPPSSGRPLRMAKQDSTGLRAGQGWRYQIPGIGQSSRPKLMTGLIIFDELIHVERGLLATGRADVMRRNAGDRSSRRNSDQQRCRRRLQRILERPPSRCLGHAHGTETGKIACSNVSTPLF